MKFEQTLQSDEWNSDTFASWKKDLISKLKEFDKKYVKHAKQTNPGLADIHKKAMFPIVELTNSGYNLKNFRKLDQGGKMPDFRKKALTEKFINDLTAICTTLTLYAPIDPKTAKPGNTLDDPFDIKHIIDMLEIEKWEECPPIAFYFTPLQAAFDKLIEVLCHMRD